MFGLKQLIEFPARVTCSSSTIIDHILASFPNRVSQQGVIDVGLSDHQIIYCTRKISRIKRGTHKQIRYHSLKNYSADIYEEALGRVDFPNYHNFENINHTYSNFIQKFIGVIDLVAPIKSRRIKQNSQEWLDGEVAEKISVCDKLFKKFKKSKLHIDKEIYKIAGYEVQKLISHKKKKFFENRLNDSIGKPKEVWKALKSLGLPSKTSVCGTTALKVKNTTSFETKSTLNVFKNYYSTLANNLLKKLPIPPNRYTFNSVRQYYRHFIQTDAFHLTYTTEIEIEKILRSTIIRKAAGIGDLSGRFLKDGSRVLSKPISELCDLSIKLGSFPDCCKIAKLKSLFKKGSKTNPSNYRSILLLSLISKIIEKVIHEQTSSFLSNNEIYQSGFWKNHSTDSCLTFLHDKLLKGFDKGLMTGMILIDHQKAFDTIDHDILLKKLSAIGFSSQTIGWFKSYLSNRLFRVHLANCYSDPSNITCGVPQGSILGPLLFLINVNDMPQAVKSNLFLYAGDSCLIFQGKDVIEIENQLNGDFTNICEWFVDNRLSIHFGEDKTKSILFASKRKIKKVPRLKISYKNSYSYLVTYLGCILDETMSRESMTLKVINKKNSRLRFLHRKNKFLTPALRRLLCNALIQPHFDYASSAWYPNLTQKMENKIQITQNKCIRYCLHLDKMTHISKNEFETLNWLPVKDRFNQSINSTVFKYFTKQCPSYLHEVFKLACPNNLRTRNSYLKLICPF